MNYNQTIQTNYKLEIPGLEEFNYFITSLSFPSWSMPGVDNPYINNQSFTPSNRIDVSEMNVNFIVDENLANYLSLYEWMRKILKNNRPFTQAKDMNFFMFNNNKQLLRKFKFLGAMPTMIGELNLESGSTDTNPLMCSTSFRFQSMEIA